MHTENVRPITVNNENQYRRPAGWLGGWLVLSNNKAHFGLQLSVVIFTPATSERRGAIPVWHASWLGLVE